jgi:hypothetical protein
MAYALSGIIGTKFDAVTAGTTTNGAGAPQPLGLCVVGSDGATRRFVQAAAALPLGSWLNIDEADQASLMTKTLTDAGYRIGVVHDVAFADNDFGWAVVDGPCTAKIAAACAADVQLYTTSTAGLVDDTAASQTLLRGCIATALGDTDSTALRACLLTNASATATP